MQSRGINIGVVQPYFGNSKNLITFANGMYRNVSQYFVLH